MKEETKAEVKTLFEVEALRATLTDILKVNFRQHRILIVRLTILIVLVFVCVVTFIIYSNNSNKANALLFEAIQKERRLIKVEREKLRLEQWDIEETKAKKGGSKYGDIESHTKDHPQHKK